MKKILVKNQVEGGQVAFDLLKESLAAGAQTLGLATGSSPIALYQEMVESDVDFSELYSVNLDEYVGLAPDHEQSYHAFMKASVFLVSSVIAKPMTTGSRTLMMTLTIFRKMAR